MSLAVKFFPTRLIAVPVALYFHCVAASATGVSSRCTRCVSLAWVVSSDAAGHASAKDAPPVTMYSYAGPVIVEPSGFFAIGSVIVVLPGVPGADASHPL